MISNKKPLWTGAGIAVALIAGAPAIADDTELLLVNPDPTQLPKPNVMFIMDTSGSMSTSETTVAPYDASRVYASGDCVSDALYWTDTDVVPSCGSDNEQWVEKTNFECESAERQLDGLGSFTNTMVQYRYAGSGGSDDEKSWNFLQPGDHTSPVECRADSGLHGDGSGDEVYAAASAGIDWTDDQDKELSWSSSPRNRSYTVYDGNYLNWKSSPELITLTRNAIMKQVTNTILSSFSNMNIGIMRFNGSDGGTVLQGVKDLDTNRSSLIAAVNSLPTVGATPLSETLYENARYWSGIEVDYSNPAETDVDALVPGLSERIYLQPTLGSCSKSYNILITDGEPNSDEDGDTRAPTLPNWFDTLGRSECNGTVAGKCLDDTAEYLSKVDITPGQAGDQSVTTHTVGFRADFPLLADTAAASGGQYFLADDIETLTSALLRIVGEINDRSLSFSAPAVSVSTFNRTQNLNDLYLTVFSARNSARWPGNLKKYGIANGSIVDADGEDAVDPATGFFYDSARSVWTTGGDDGADVLLGGAARQLPGPATRNLYTNNGSSNVLSAASNALSTTISGSYTPADFGLTGAAGEPTVEQMLDWMRGVDVQNEDNDDSTSVRYAMGDPLHSRPAAVVYGSTDSSTDVVVFTATNDGYVHAIDGSSGEELWAFVPRELLPNMARLYDNPSSAFKQYGVDGDIVPVVNDVDGDGVLESDDGDFVRLVMGMRRGGQNYYALDVTNRTAPRLLWTKTLDNAGQSWSAPVVTRMNIDDSGLNDDKAVVILGGGYDPVHDTPDFAEEDDAVGAGLHILDLVSGDTLWHGGGPDSDATQEFDDMNRAFPTEIRVIDLNGDRLADRMYAVDIGGGVWRFDIKAGEAPSDLINGGAIAQLGPKGTTSGDGDGVSAADTRRFYNAPDVSVFRDPVSGQRYVSLALGSGYRAHPLDTAAADRFYALRDPAVFNTLTQENYDDYDVIEEADLLEVSGSVKNVVGASSRGWMFTLRPNEKILASSTTFDNEIFFVSFDPTTVGAANCGTGQGSNFLYRVSIVNGDPVVNNLDAIVPGTEDNERRTQLAQGGIAPSPNVLFPSAISGDTSCQGSACNPPPVMCIGVECGELGFLNVPVRTLWSQDGIE